MYSKKVTTNSGRPVKRARSSGFCVATPTGQVSRWQTRIITQPLTTSGAVAKPNSSAPEQRGDDHVPPGLQLTVRLHDDPVAQAVEEQRLLRLGQAQLPRRAGVLQRREGRGAGAAVVARDEHDVGLGLADPGGHRPDADLGHQLHVDPRPRVGVLEVVDELLQVLDGVDVVVGRRRDQPDARRRVPGPGDPRVHLVAGELAALARLGALRHLDLQVVGADQVLARDAEAPGRHLLDGRAPGVAVGQRHVALGVLAALAGVALAAEAVHGDGEGLVGLGRDRAVGHGPGREAADDLADRLDLLERDRRPVAEAELEQAPQGGQATRLVVDQAGVLLEDVVAAGPRGVLQLEHRLRVEEVVLALPPPLVLAAELQASGGPAPRAGAGGRRRWRAATSAASSSRPTPPRRETVPVKYSSTSSCDEADGLEDLRARVAGHRRDAHLGHHLEHALAGGLDVALHRLGRIGAAEPVHARAAARRDHVLDRLEGQVGVDGAGAEADEERHVVHLAGVAGLDDQADLGPGLLPDQVVVDGRREQQRRDGRVDLVRVAVGEHDDAGALVDGLADLGADAVEGPLEGQAAARPRGRGRR